MGVAHGRINAGGARGKASSAVALAREDDSCAICLGALQKPRTLSCGHQFCAGCLDSAAASELAAAASSIHCVYFSISTASSLASSPRRAATARRSARGVIWPAARTSATVATTSRSFNGIAAGKGRAAARRLRAPMLRGVS